MKIRILPTVLMVFILQNMKVNPVLRTPVGNTKHFRDPKVWQDSDNFYMVLGSQEENGLGRALLYRSKNLIDWEFISVLSQAIDCDREVLCGNVQISSD